jgi:hypothetical protein
VNRAGRLIGIVVVALLASACETTRTSNTPLDTGTPLGTGSPGDSGGAGPIGTPGGSVRIDPSLLAILPRTVDSAPVVEDSDGDDAIRGDDVIPTFASAAVGAAAADTATNNLAFGYVVKLRPNAFTDAIYRDWRDTFDGGVCNGASEVVGTASATVAGNTVWIGTCSNDIRTYHVWIKEKGILISLWSTGEKRFGLVIMGNLRT